MLEEVREAGLDQCDMRMLYRRNRTSTPTGERICSNDNLSCWDQGPNFEASRVMSRSMTEDEESMEDPFPPPLADSPLSITLSTDLDASKESRPDVDISYGGAWAMEEDKLTQGFYDFGISIFDSSDEQVSKCLERSDQSLMRIIPNRVSKDQGQEKKEIKVAKTLEKVKGFLRVEREEEQREEGKELLEMRVCHKKSKDELRKEAENTNNLNDFRPKKLRILVNNVRGWYSKKESFQSILCKNKIDVAMIVETFMTASRYPELPGYVTYYRNRESRAAGGIAIMIREEISKYVVKTDSGKLENEFLVLKFTNTQPNLVLIVYYGVQSGTFGTDQVKLHMSQLFEVIRKYRDQNCSINVCGDF